ncbi:outer membrane protein assembly factor BamD [bacterium]|nr:outer membrane protein assembly factor BamD [bacterium]
MFRLIVKIRYCIPVLLYIFLAVSCGSSREFNERTESGLFDAGKYFYYEKKDHFSSQRKLEMFVRLYPGSTVIDSAYYLLAGSYYGLDEYISAGSEYQNLIRNFPNSDLADDAQYMIAMSNYGLSPEYALDQQYSVKAIDEFTILIEDYPASDYIEDAQKKIEELAGKLAEKKYKGAEQYRKMGYYSAAINYYTDVLEYYSDSQWAAESLFYIGICEMKLENYENTKKIFEAFAQKYSEHALMIKVNEALQQLKGEKLSSNK